METCAHDCLKRLAVAHVQRAGYLAAACEVRCSIPRWVADVAGWTDGWFDASLGRRISCEPRTIIVECKQSRADFLRDSRRLDALFALREWLEGIRQSIEEHRVKTIEPHLRVAGTSLFAELDDWDFRRSRLPSYRRTIERLERIDARLHGETKFFRLARYAAADALYLAAPEGLLKRRDLPHGWGLLEAPRDALLSVDERAASDAANLVTRIEAPPLCSTPRARQRLLRNIAIAACKLPRAAKTATRGDADMLDPVGIDHGPHAGSVFNTTEPTLSRTFASHGGERSISTEALAPSSVDYSA